MIIKWRKKAALLFLSILGFAINFKFFLYEESDHGSVGADVVVKVDGDSLLSSSITPDEIISSNVELNEISKKIKESSDNANLLRDKLSKLKDGMRSDK